MHTRYPHAPGTRLSEGPEFYRAVMLCENCGHPHDLSVKGLDWTIKSPADAAMRLLAQSHGLEQEHLTVLSLNAKNRVLDETVVYVGNVSAALTRVAEIMREPVRQNASGMILAHNHPSGDPTPSPDDLHLTAEVLAAARLLDIDMLDHIVLGAGTFASLRDRGVSFDRDRR